MRNRQPKAIQLSSIGDINTEVSIPLNPGYILNDITTTNVIQENDIKEDKIQNIELQTDNISNVVINKFKKLGINITDTNINLVINNNKGNCLRLSNNTDNTFVDFKVKNNGILTITPNDKTILISSTNKINTSNPLTLLNYPNITSENNLGVGLNFDLKNNIDTIKTFGSISILGDNVTNNKENGNLIIDLVNNGNLNKSVLSLTSNGILSITRLVESSDIRIKENINLTNIEDSYNKIMNIKVKNYNYINDSKKIKYNGVIAQELKKIIPNAVTIEQNKNYDDFHSISNTEILYHLIAAVQYLSLNK